MVRHAVWGLALLLWGGGLIGRAAEPAPQGIVVNPTPSELKVEVWTDKDRYLPGEQLRIHVRLNRPAYLYLYDVDPQGRVTLLLPNGYEVDGPREAGEHRFPTQRYSLVVEGAPGVELIQALASLEPLDLFELSEATPSPERPFVLLQGEPARVAAAVERLIAERLAPERWAADWTQFRVVSPPRPRWLVRSVPSEAELTLDGELVGLTPEELTLPAPARLGGRSQVELALAKAGYRPWAGALRLTLADSGALRVELLGSDPTGVVTYREGGLWVIEVHLQPQAGSAPGRGAAAPPSDTQTPSAGEIPSLPLEDAFSSGGSLAVNLGGHPQGLSTFGVEFGLGAVRFGLSLADTGQAVPPFFDLGRPEDLGPEQVFRQGPEVELYLKLVLSTGVVDGLALEVGAGLVQQTLAHVAAPVPAGGLPQVVEVLPNGYLSESLRGTALVGLAYRVGAVLLQLGYDTHRGLVGGLGLAF